MRILRICPGANDPRHRQRELALARRGHEVGLVLPDSYGSDWQVAEVEADIRAWRARLWNRRSIPFHLWPPWVVARAIREFDPDVVDIHEEPYWPAGGELTWLGRRRPLAMYTAQNTLRSLPRPVAAMQRTVLARAGACYPCCSQAAGVLRSRGYRGHIEVVPLGVDDRLFAVQPRGDRIGFIGRFTSEKGVDALVRYGPRLLAVGEGPLAASIRAAGGEVRPARSFESLIGALAEMAVLAAPSRTTRTWREQFGRMAIEAMAAGVPVVATDSGSLPEVVGDAGIIVPEGDAQALHRAIAAVLAEPGDLGELGRRRARALYRWDGIAAKLEHVYKEALAA